MLSKNLALDVLRLIEGLESPRKVSSYMRFTCYVPDVATPYSFPADTPEEARDILVSQGAISEANEMVVEEPAEGQTIVRFNRVKGGIKG